MRTFFNARVQNHQKRMQRYLKYVFNDHFALLMTFLLGGMGLYYSNSLKELTVPFLPGRFILLVIWLLSLNFGRYATLTQEADQVFLLPKETQMRLYLKSALRYSCYFPFGIGVLIIGASMPLYVVSTGNPIQMYFLLLGAFLFLKLAHLYVQQLAVFQVGKRYRFLVNVVFWVLAVLSYSLTLFYSPIVGLIATIVIFMLSYYQLWWKLVAPIDWEGLIALENKRLYRVYRFINLFTDVPQITATVKRRKFLDYFLKYQPLSHQNTYFYLYSRRFLRGTEFSGLVLRLVIVGSLILWFVSQFWLALLISLIVNYLIAFQLLPMFNQFDYLQTTQLYPVSKQMKVASFKKILWASLIFTTLIFGIVGSIHLSGFEQVGLFWLGLLVFDAFLALFYIPNRLKKIY